MRTALGALSGGLAGFAALAVAELVAAGVRPQASPVVVVGGASIDQTPAAVKDWAIRDFGTDDKLVLQFGILVVLALLALCLGALAVRRRLVGAAGVLLFGVIGATAALTRPDSRGLTDALPSLTGATVGALLLYLLAGRLITPVPVPDGESAEPGTWDRRGFVIAATSTAAASAVVGGVGRTLSGNRAGDAVASREQVVLPRPGSPAQPTPRRAALRVDGASPYVTPNKSFYRVDTALVVPKVDATAWRLRVHGKGVTRPPPSPSTTCCADG